MTTIDVDCLPGDPKQEKELEGLRTQLREQRDRIGVLARQCEVLSDQLRGGGRDVDPRTDEGHAGHVLIELGWKYIPDEDGDPDDEIGVYWHDPQELRETGAHSVMPLTMALNIALRRLMGQQATQPKSRAQRLMED